MATIKGLINKLLKKGALETVDREREDQLLSILEIVKQKSLEDWILKRNESILKEIIYTPTSIFMGIKAYEIYETIPYVLSHMDHGRGIWIRFASSDVSVFCQGEITTLIDSRFIKEKVVRGKTAHDTHLLNFFENIRLGLIK